MINLIRTYLLQYKSISIPGLGTIYIEKTPAQSDFVNRQLLPPSYHYRFDKYFDAPGKEFLTYLAARKKIEDYEAIKVYNEWALQLRNSISAETPAIIEGIGELRRNGSGDVVFEASVKPAIYYEPLPAERIIRTNARHTMLVGDKETTNVEMTDYLHETHKEKKPWWVYALIVAAVALVAIIFTLYKNGAGTPFGNQQKIQVK